MSRFCDVVPQNPAIALRYPLLALIFVLFFLHTADQHSDMLLLAQIPCTRAAPVRTPSSRTPGVVRTSEIIPATLWMGLPDFFDLPVFSFHPRLLLNFCFQKTVNLQTVHHNCCIHHYFGSNVNGYVSRDSVTLRTLCVDREDAVDRREIYLPVDVSSL